MHSSSLTESIDAVSMVIEKTHKPQFSMIGFYIVAVLFNLCLGLQLLTVGLAILPILTGGKSMFGWLGAMAVYLLFYWSGCIQPLFLGESAS